MAISKQKGTLTLDEIKKNIEELRYRAEDLVNPEYEVHELYNPDTKRIENFYLSRVQWWEVWKKQERFLSEVQRNPFKRLGQIRASTDDHHFQQIGKLFEDLLVQVDLLSQFMALQTKEESVTAPPAELPVAATELDDAVMAEELDVVLTDKDLEILGSAVNDAAAKPTGDKRESDDASNDEDEGETLEFFDED